MPEIEQPIHDPKAALKAGLRWAIWLFVGGLASVFAGFVLLGAAFGAAATADPSWVELPTQWMVAGFGDSRATRELFTIVAKVMLGAGSILMTVGGVLGLWSLLVFSTKDREKPNEPH